MLRWPSGAAMPSTTSPEVGSGATTMHACMMGYDSDEDADSDDDDEDSDEDDDT